MKRVQNQNGYLTVEATLVFSVVLFSLMFIMFIGILLYQQVSYQSMALRTASRGANIYSSLSHNMSTGYVKLSDFKSRDPYRYIWDSNINSREQIINDFVSDNMDKNTIKKGDDKSKMNYTEVKNYFISKKTYVGIKVDYLMPEKGTAKMFGIKSPFSINARGSSTVGDPAELIRNTDLCIDILKNYDVTNNGMEKLSEIKEKIIGYKEILELD